MAFAALGTGVVGPLLAMTFDIDAFAAAEDVAFVRLVIPPLDTLSADVRVPRERVMTTIILAEVYMGSNTVY